MSGWADFSRSKSYNTQTDSLDPFVRGQAANAYGRFLGDYNPGGGMYQGGELLRRTMRGDYLNPLTNPAVQNLTGAATTSAQNLLGTGIRDVQSRMGGAGIDTGSAFGQQAGELSRNMGADLGSALAQMLLGQYSQERGYQMRAPGEYANLLQGMFDPLGAFRFGQGWGRSWSYRAAGGGGGGSGGGGAGGSGGGGGRG